jgi:tagatose-1,6-bisphosphate aldolase non-catalytic subunit AgaZ/GatZ
VWATENTREATGKTQEKVHDVAWSGARRLGADGKLPPVGNTVNVKNATRANTIGAPELITVWEDPDFDPGRRAFYYVLVIEIPTPHWTAYDAKRFNVKLPEGAPKMHQERAYTSPI